MFYLEVHRPDGSLNDIEVIRLKDKLGTRQLPTAELLLDGTKAFRVSFDMVMAISNLMFPLYQKVYWYKIINPPVRRKSYLYPIKVFS